MEGLAPHTLEDLDGLGQPEALRTAHALWCQAFNYDQATLKKYMRDDHESTAFLRAYGYVKPFNRKTIEYDCKVSRPELPAGRTYKGRGDNANAEVEQLGKWASENNAFCRSFSALVNDKTGAEKTSSKRAVNGVAVVPKEYVNRLTDNCFVVLLDATHNTNCWGWYLFTLLVRDKFGSWVPGGHFYTESQHASIIEAGFRAIRSFVAGFQPTYIILDDSAAEQKAVRDLQAGCTTLLCQKHWKDAIFKHISGPAYISTRRWVQKALYFAIDDKECGQMCDRALESVPQGIYNFSFLPSQPAFPFLCC